MKKDLFKDVNDFSIELLGNYKSPIEIITDDVSKNFEKQIENNIIRFVKKYDIFIDEKELIDALKYDRHQYEKGYRCGYNENKWLKTENEIPIDDKFVLVCDKVGNMETAYLNDEDNEWITKDFSYEIEDFPYWQPLPQVPKELLNDRKINNAT